MLKKIKGKSLLKVKKKVNKYVTEKKNFKLI